MPVRTAARDHGSGKTAAAAVTARALASYDPAGLTVLNIGTAGALRPGLVGIHEPGVVLNHDLSADVIRAPGLRPAGAPRGG